MYCKQHHCVYDTYQGECPDCVRLEKLLTEIREHGMIETEEIEMETETEKEKETAALS